MKDKQHILTQQEAEDLCRAYMECRLSVLEERELQYVIAQLQYDSPLIEETRALMIAEGLAFPEKEVRMKPGFGLKRWMIGIAASVAVLIAVSMLIGHGGGPAVGHGDATVIMESSEDIVIAYDGGKRLSQEDSEKAVEESRKRAQALIAMAEKKMNEDRMKSEYYMNLTNDK